MASPYTSVTITGYNSNPPADDGSQVSTNKIKWQTHKDKIGDPLKTALESVNSNIATAFGKTVGGAGVTSTGVTYTVTTSDQGKLVRATASGITITTPDATTVSSPFVFAVLNNSSDTITFDGNGSQTVDGDADILVAAGAGFLVYTDGSNWFTTGRLGTLSQDQVMYGDIINGTIQESNATNAATFSLKTIHGDDPSAADPVLVAFRNATVGNGNYVYRIITAAVSLTIPSGATLGALDGVPFKVWLVLFDDGGTIRIGAINCVSSKNIYPLGRMPIVSSTTIGTGADAAHVFYSGTGVTSKPYVILGYAAYESDGLTTAGSWNESPTRLQLFGHGVPLPGVKVQDQIDFDAAAATGTTTIDADNSIPPNTQGDQYLSQAITPTSSANILEIEWVFVSAQTGANFCITALFQDSTVDALATMPSQNALNNISHDTRGLWRILAGTLSETTFKLRAGPGTAATLTFNGASGAGLFNGTIPSQLKVTELMG